MVPEVTMTGFQLVDLYRNGFFEGAAGFGTPVAVTAAMLIGLALWWVGRRQERGGVLGVRGPGRLRGHAFGQAARRAGRGA